MARPLFARGAHGDLIAELQKPLLPAQDVDGIYGGATTAAVARFQRALGVQPTGAVDSDLWTSITHLQVPSTFDRALAVTVAMEGHHYTLAEGDFDRQGITWGLVGFTLANGELAYVFDLIEQAAPGVIAASFGPLTPDLRRMLPLKNGAARAFVASISDGNHLDPQWREAFARLGSDGRVQRVQYDYTRRKYGTAALDIVHEFDLKTELSFALAFDIAVQITFGAGVRNRIHRQLAQHPVTRESEVRSIIAHAVAETAVTQSRADVLGRKMTFATGAGVVHRDTYVLANWGLGDFPM